MQLNMIEIDQNIIDREHCGMCMLENGYRQAEEPPPHDAPPVRLWTSFKPYIMPVMKAGSEAPGVKEGKEGWPKYCWCKFLGIDPVDGSGLLEPVPRRVDDAPLGRRPLDRRLPVALGRVRC